MRCSGQSHVPRATANKQTRGGPPPPQRRGDLFAHGKITSAMMAKVAAARPATQRKQRARLGGLPAGATRVACKSAASRARAHSPRLPVFAASASCQACVGQARQTSAAASGHQVSERARRRWRRRRTTTKRPAAGPEVAAEVAKSDERLDTRSARADCSHALPRLMALRERSAKCSELYAK